MSSPLECAAPSTAASSATWAALVVLAFPTAFWLVAYLLPQLYMALRPVPDLKKRYNADWALVTGGGSGIGKALAFKLASQGLNVVVVSLDDDYLAGTMKELAAAYPKLQFRAVGVNFAPGVKYMDKIRAATKDIDIPIVFSNAGFIVTGTLQSMSYSPRGSCQAMIDRSLARLLTHCNRILFCPQVSLNKPRSKRSCPMWSAMLRLASMWRTTFCNSSCSRNGVGVWSLHRASPLRSLPPLRPCMRQPKLLCRNWPHVCTLNVNHWGLTCVLSTHLPWHPTFTKNSITR